MTDEARANAIAAVEQTLRNAGLLDDGFAGEVQMLVERFEREYMPVTDSGCWLR